MDIAELTDKLRVIYDIDMDDDKNVYILNQCVKKISEEYPKIVKSFIKTVAGQDRYAVDHDDLIKLSKVYYTIGGDENEFITDFSVPSSGSLSSQFTTIYENEMYGRLNPIDADIVNYNEFDLIPAPVGGMKVFYEYEAYRTLAEIPGIFEEVLIKLFFFYERDNEYKKTMRTNDGNVFAFDRRGNIQNQGSSVNDRGLSDRDLEYNEIVKNIRSIIMRLKR